MSMEDIIAVARKANIHQFITNLPQVIKIKQGLQHSKLVKHKHH